MMGHPVSEKQNPVSETEISRYLIELSPAELRSNVQEGGKGEGELMRGRWKRRRRRLQRHLRPRREVFEDQREDINIQDTQRAVNPFRRKFQRRSG